MPEFHDLPVILVAQKYIANCVNPTFWKSSATRSQMPCFKLTSGQCETCGFVMIKPVVLQNICFFNCGGGAAENNIFQKSSFQSLFAAKNFFSTFCLHSSRMKGVMAYFLLESVSPKCC